MKEENTTTPREKQARFRTAIKMVGWYILGIIILSAPELMILHWIIFGY